MMSDDEVSHVSQSPSLCSFMESTPLNGVKEVFHWWNDGLGL